MYIRQNGLLVELGGEVATEQMIEDGWFEYKGEVPTVHSPYSYIGYVDGALVEVVDEGNLDKAKQDKLLEIASTYESKIRELTGGATMQEIASWTKQEQEARAYLADKDTYTPMLSGLVASRLLGETIEELANNIVAKANAYTDKYSIILGEYQSRQKQVALAGSIAAVLVI